MSETKKGIRHTLIITKDWQGTLVTEVEDPGGHWVTINGRHIFITGLGSVDDNMPLRHNKELGNWEGRHRGIHVYMEDNVKNPEQTFDAYCQELDKVEPAQGAGVKVVWLHEGEGRNFKAGGQQFKTGAEYSLDFKRVDAYGGDFKDDAHWVLGHESGHGVYDEAAMRSQTSGIGDFRAATDKEGGVSDYASAWISEASKGKSSGRDWDIGYNENFAEMTRMATFEGGKTAGGRLLRAAYPKTYKAWRVVMDNMNTLAKDKGFSNTFGGSSS